MQVEQAVFTSVRTKRSQGYHLVAMSPGIDEQLARSLSIWGPSHASLMSDDPTAHSFNFHPVVDSWYAVSRTVHGGPEYSRRGGLQVFTHFLLVQKRQFESYDYNPLCLARTAQSLGCLRLISLRFDQLPAVDLPERTLLPPPRLKHEASVPLGDILRILRLKQRIAILGPENPLPVMGRILQDIPRDERLAISFSTGLRPSVDRSFRVLFAQRADSALHGQLAAQGIDYVSMA